MKSFTENTIPKKAVAKITVLRFWLCGYKLFQVNAEVVFHSFILMIPFGLSPYKNVRLESHGAITASVFAVIGTINYVGNLFALLLE